VLGHAHGQRALPPAMTNDQRPHGREDRDSPVAESRAGYPASVGEGATRTRGPDAR
jgi:hypothetical protein